VDIPVEKIVKKERIVENPVEMERIVEQEKIIYKVPPPTLALSFLTIFLHPWINEEILLAGSRCVPRSHGVSGSSR
jgi:hypothetical protein